MKPVIFVLVVHDHQPIGNFDHVIAEAYERAYRPFLDVMQDFPDVPFGLHVSGPLWEWLEKFRPDFFDLCLKMTARGQLELIGGGFYEPILPVLPRRDQIGQINLMNKRVERTFGLKPSGLWTTERVWEPQLPEVLQQCGIRYTFLDDTHFHAAGFAEQELDGIYLTGHAEHRLLLFPISQKMRYAAPFKPPEIALEEILAVQKSDRETLVCLADDGEKFGLWPGTYGTCYEEGWLAKFLQMLLDYRHRIHTLKPQDAVQRLKPIGRAYLPTASYFEMTEWALPAEKAHALTRLRAELEAGDKLPLYLPFLKGGHWRNFLVKYEEAARLYHRMLAVSRRIADLPADFQRREEAEAALFRAQCNCAYWHGIFGGLYLPHLRAALWSNLIEADRICALYAPHPPVSIVDVDGDGEEDLRIVGKDMALTVSLADGTLSDFELFHPPVNLLDTMMRRPEAYHAKIRDAIAVQESAAGSIHSALRVKERGMERFLLYDLYPRRGAIEHWLNDGANEWEFEAGATRMPARAVTAAKLLDNGVEFALASEQLAFNKRFETKTDSAAFELCYNLSVSHQRPGRFGVEWCINLRDGHSDQTSLLINGTRNANPQLDIRETVEKVQRVDFVCQWMPLHLELTVAPAARLHRLPLYTVSASEAGVERIFQGTLLLLSWHTKQLNRISINWRSLPVR